MARARLRRRRRVLLDGARVRRQRRRGRAGGGGAWRSARSRRDRRRSPASRSSSGTRLDRRRSSRASARQPRWPRIAATPEALRRGCDRAGATSPTCIGPDVVRLEPAAASLTLSPALAASPRCVYDTTRFGTALIYARRAGRSTRERQAGARRHHDAARRRRRRRCAIPTPAQRRPPISTSRDAGDEPHARCACRCDRRRSILDFGDGLDRRRHRAQRRHRRAPSCRSARSSPATSRRAPPTIAPSSATSCWRGWSSTSGRPRPIPASTSSPRTASSPIAPASSGRSCRSRSTAPSGAAIGRRSRCCSPRRCCRRRSTCGSTPTIATASTASRPSTARACYVVRFTPNATSTAQVALSRHGVDRSRDVPPPQAAGGADRPGGAGRVERRDGALRHGRRAPAAAQIFLPIETVTRQIVLVAGRNILVEKTTRFSEYQLNPGDFEARRARGAAQRSHHVPRHRQGHALLRQGRRHARRQRQGDDQRQGDGDRHDDRSVVRLPAADPRHQLSRFRVRQPRLAARAAVRRRARARQHPAAEADRPDRRQRRLLRHRRAGQRSRLRRRRAARRRARADVAALGRRQSRLAVHQLPEAAGELPVRLQRASSRIGRPPRTSSCRAARSRTASAWATSTGARGYSLVANGTWYGRQAWERVGAGRRRDRDAAHLHEVQRVGGQGDLSLAADQGAASTPPTSAAAISIGSAPTSSGCSTTPRSTACRPPASATTSSPWCAARTRSTPSSSTASTSSSIAAGAGCAAPAAPTGKASPGSAAAFNLRAPWSTILRAEIGKSFLASRYRENGSVVAQILFLKPLKSKSK